MSEHFEGAQSSKGHSSSGSSESNQSAVAKGDEGDSSDPDDSNVDKSTARTKVTGKQVTGDAGAGRPSIVLQRPTTAQLAARGITRRCPWCGDRKAYFTGWFERSDHCRNCGRGYRRGDDAFELGAITANIIFTFLSIGIGVAVVAFLLLGTDLDLSTPMVLGIGAFFVLLAPALFYPISFTMWQAVDLVMREPTEEELTGGEDATL